MEHILRVVRGDEVGGGDHRQPRAFLRLLHRLGQGVLCWPLALLLRLVELGGGGLRVLAKSAGRAWDGGQAQRLDFHFVQYVRLVLVLSAQVKVA